MAQKERARRDKAPPLSWGERRRLRQLVVCVALFAAVFVGRGVDLAPVTALSERVGTIVRGDTDFQAVFARVGASFSQGEGAVETFRALWSSADEEGTPANAEPAPDPAAPDGEEGADAPAGP